MNSTKKTFRNKIKSFLFGKRYENFRWKFRLFCEKYFGGHVSIGSVTIYGANAMNYAVNIKTKKWGYVCFTLPFLAAHIKNRRGNWYWRLKLYCSNDGTPGHSTYYRGTVDGDQRIMAMIRKKRLGHNPPRTEENNNLMGALRNKFEGFYITEEDIQDYINWCNEI